MRVILIILTSLLIVNSSLGQSLPSKSSVDIDVAAAKWQGTLSTAFVHDWSLGTKKRFVVGIGGRATAYLGRNQYYVTAPAQLTSGSTGPLVFFKENIVANMDTFLIANPFVLSVNAMVHLGYQFNERLSMGFNIDAIGFSLGASKTGNYINGAQGARSTSKPTVFNALLVSDNDLGTLNSQLYMKYGINKVWSLRTGLQFLFTEYTTKEQLQQLPEPNDRFRKKSLMFMIGTSIKIN